MSNILFQNLFISVGIDVGADFSWMSIALPNQTFVGKPFKILHSDLNSLSLAVSKIKKAVNNVISKEDLTELKVACIPITSGLGEISNFSQIVCTILTNHCGVQAFVTEKKTLQVCKKPTNKNAILFLWQMIMPLAPFT